MQTMADAKKLSELLLNSKWRRPASVPYPNTWHSFTTKLKNGKKYNIKIVDLTPDRFEEIDEFELKYLYPYEPLMTSAKLLEDEVSLHNMRLLEKAVSHQRVSLIAVLDEDVPKPTIVGVQKLSVKMKGDETTHVPGKWIQKLANLFDFVEEKHDAFEIFNTDTIMKGYGLCVKPEFRGLDIGYNLISSIEKLARGLSIKAVIVYYTSIFSQILAERVGFKLLDEIIYNEYKDDEGNVLFPVEETKSIKFVGFVFS